MSEAHSLPCLPACLPAYLLSMQGLSLVSDGDWRHPSPVARACLAGALGLLLAFGVAIACLVSVAGGVMVVMALLGAAGEGGGRDTCRLWRHACSSTHVESC